MRKLTAFIPTIKGLGFLPYDRKRTHGIPALFSFFVPGLGQLVKGHLFKALGIWIAFMVTGPIHFIGFGISIWLVIWVWQLYDAYNA